MIDMLLGVGLCILTVQYFVYKGLVADNVKLEKKVRRAKRLKELNESFKDLDIDEIHEPFRSEGHYNATCPPSIHVDDTGRKVHKECTCRLRGKNSTCSGRR